GDILTQTAEIIGDKIEIEQEIETTITGAKSETYMMLVLPILLVVAMSAMGGELMSSLFEFPRGTMAATAALVLFAVSYVIAVKVSDINL
ncbi:MAG: pilus assembly protein TadB, partial [Clostridia bacterium]|nr:pilus assembly protein TadB [Clostridia bacterium]